MIKTALFHTIRIIDDYQKHYPNDYQKHETTLNDLINHMTIVMALLEEKKEVA